VETWRDGFVHENLCEPKWRFSHFGGNCIHWKLSRLKTKKEQCKTDEERTQLNILEDIDNHTWFFVYAEVDFWSLLYTLEFDDVDVGFGVVNQTRKVPLPAWRFRFWRREQTPTKLKGADWQLLTTKCLQSCPICCVVGSKREAIWCVELVHGWVSVDLWPYTCYTEFVGWLLTCVYWTTLVIVATNLCNIFRLLHSNIWWLGCYVFPQIDRVGTWLVER